MYDEGDTERSVAVVGRANTHATWIPDLVVENPRMQDLYRLAERIAPTNAPVLILGETGTGKDLLARFIAGKSNRPLARLRTLNCGALPQQLIEAALFGHERGAFTGAIKSTVGIFEQAQGGTVFLDEVGELSAGAQAALLRVLESGHLTRIGSEREIQVDARVIAATTRDLDAMVEQGTFRQDLLYRLNTLTLEVVPLRERSEEIVPLARGFLRAAAARWRGALRELSEEVEQRMLAYHWPGNVRQLRNVLERAALVCEGSRIELHDLPVSIACPQALEREPIAATTTPQGELKLPKVGLREALRLHEIALIQRALESTGGNQRRAAELLEIPRRTLVRKLRGL